LFNKIILIGRLTRDPEPKYTQNGVAVTKFNIAVDRPFSKEKEVDYIDIVTWQKLAEICSSQLGKGRLVAVEGRLQIRSYEDNQGSKRKAAEVVAESVKFLDWPKDKEGQTPAGNKPSQGSNFSNGTIDFSEDDISF